MEKLFWKMTWSIIFKDIVNLRLELYQMAIWIFNELEKFIAKWSISRYSTCRARLICVLPLNYGKGIEARVLCLQFYKVSLFKLPTLHIKKQDIYSVLLTSWSEHPVSSTVIIIFSMMIVMLWRYYFNWFYF